MIGYREVDEGGNKVFVATSCEFCQMDTAGNHDYGCPNRKPRIDVEWEYPTKGRIGAAEVSIIHEHNTKTITPVKNVPPNTTIEYREPVEGSG